MKVLFIEFVDYIAMEETGLNNTSCFDLEGHFQGHKGFCYFASMNLFTGLRGL